MKKLMGIVLLSCFIVLTGCQGNNSQTQSQQPTEAAVSSQEAAVSSQEAPQQSAEEAGGWEYIANKGELIIGLDDTFAPMGFRDEADNLIGFDIDLATAVCEKLGVTPKFQPIEWSAKEMELSTKKIDCIWNGMSITPERQESMSLTRGYLNNRIIVMTVPGVEVNTLEDLKGLTIGTQAKSAALEVVQQHAIFSELDEIHEYNTYDEVIMDMDAGRIQAMIVDEVLGMYKNAKREKSLTVAAVDFGDDFYAVGFRKEDTQLTQKVQEAIDALVAEGTAANISEKWFGKDIVIKQ